MKTAVTILVGAAVIVVFATLIYADWWSFNQKFPHASFWAWVISPK